MIMELNESMKRTNIEPHPKTIFIGHKDSYQRTTVDNVDY